ncbi:MAG: hypothetical protein ACRDY6_00295 [Acidimicrobiia bacterium]
MSLNYLTSQVVLDTALKASVEMHLSIKTGEHDSYGDRVLPRELSDFLARLRLLEGVPFAYLVPDVDLLPVESIRFFYIDRAWTDAIVQGALSVGTVSTADHAQLERVYPFVRDELDEAERSVRVKGQETAPQGPARTITGFLLRSRAVSGWPGMHVRAYREELGVADDAQIPETDPRRLKMLRLERLAPAVLLALFDGVPAVVHVEEPRQGIQFGFRPPDPPDPDPNHRVGLVPPRKISDGSEVFGPAQDDEWVRVAFRKDAPGVVNLRTTRNRLQAVTQTGMGPTVDSAEFAIQMLRYPYRQVFGDPGQEPRPIGDVFRPKLGLASLKQRFIEGLES